MKKSNLVLQAAVLSTLLASATANAGVISGGLTIDTETAPASAISIALTGLGAAVKYQLSGLSASGQAISEGSTIVVYLKLTGATFGANAITSDFTIAGFPTGTGASAVTAVAINAAKDIAAVSVKIGTTGVATLVIPNTATVSWAGAATKGTLDVANVKTMSVSAQGYLDLIGAAPTNAAVFAIPTTTQDSSTSTLVFSTAPSVAAAVASSGDTVQIDLATTPVVGSAFTSTGLSGSSTLANLAKLTLTNATTAPTLYAAPPVAATVGNLGADGTAAQKVTITPAAGKSFTAGTVFSVNSASNCAAGTNVAATTVLAPATAAVAATTTSVVLTVANAAIPVAAPTGNTTAGSVSTLYVCAKAPTTATAMTPISYTIVNELSTTNPDTATGTSVALDYNGQVKYVRNYIPAAVTGFTEIVRISNSGSVPAPVTVTMYSESGAQIGTPYTTASLAAGATTRLSQATIEAGVGGTLASTDRPRLKIAAPTNSLDVQSLMFSNGVYTNLSGAE